MKVINLLTNIYISSSKSIKFLAMTRLSGTLLKRTVLLIPWPFVVSMFLCNLHWMPRYCLVAKNFWLALSELATAHELCSQEKTFLELTFFTV